MPVQMMSGHVRNAVYTIVKEAADRDIAARSMAAPSVYGHCLDYAWHGYRVIKALPGAPRTIIQAGSAYWPRVAPELDDGVMDTHFGYCFDSDSPLARMAREGMVAILRRADNGREVAAMPEIHVWLACPDTKEIIDFTTGTWPETCMSLLGQQWLAPRPPAYLWDFPHRWPQGVRYEPDRAAIDIALAFLEQQDRDYP